MRFDQTMSRIGLPCFTRRTRAKKINRGLLVSAVMLQYSLRLNMTCCLRLAHIILLPSRRSPSPTRQSLFDVLLSAVQAPHPVTEEVFELRIAVMRQDGGVASYDVRWCSAEGNPQPPCSQVSRVLFARMH